MAEGAVNPLVSVVVLTFNRPQLLQRCLVSLVDQTLGTSKYDVIVVDASSPNIGGVLERFKADLRLYHVPVVNRGVAANRNIGAEHAHGRLLAFLDDDCVASPNWLEELVAAIHSDPRLLASALIVHPEPKTATAAAGQLITQAVVDFSRLPGSQPRFVPGLNFALHRDRYHQLGGCDEGFGFLAAEDRDFIGRWQHAGGRLVLLNSCHVHHSHRNSLHGFIRQYFNYGRGAWRYHRLRRKRLHGHIRQDVRFHMEMPMRLARGLKIFPLRFRLQVPLLIIVWELSNLAGFLWQAWLEWSPRLPGRGHQFLRSLSRRTRG